MLSAVVEKDYGEYSCRASNLLEEDVTQKITLTGEKDCTVRGVQL